MADFDFHASFRQAPVARLGTIGPGGSPHLVPVVFAVRDEVIYTAVDAKPKTTRRLRRLANIASDPRVSLLVDGYHDDWAQLWWVRVDGAAAIHQHDDVMRAGYQALRAKYPQYRSVRLDGPVIAITALRWTTWHA